MTNDSWKTLPMNIIIRLVAVGLVLYLIDAFILMLLPQSTAIANEVPVVVVLLAALDLITMFDVLPANLFLICFLY
jgi:hypothetical protein